MGIAEGWGHDRVLSPPSAARSRQRALPTRAHLAHAGPQRARGGILLAIPDEAPHAAEHRAADSDHTANDGHAYGEAAQLCCRGQARLRRAGSQDGLPRAAPAHRRRQAAAEAVSSSARLHRLLDFFSAQAARSDRLWRASKLGASGARAHIVLLAAIGAPALSNDEL